VTVLGGPGSSAEKVARRLDIALGTAVPVAWPGSEVASGALVFVDDAPRDRGEGRAKALAICASARAAGRHVLVFHSEKAALAWAKAATSGEVSGEAAPMRRVYLASGESSASEETAQRLAVGLGLPLLEPEADHPGHDYAGWGPRYEALSREESWLIHSPTWHAVESLCARADLVILFERSDDPREEFPSPTPQGKVWRRLFGPWLARYPRVEARLLEREIERHDGEAPVLRVRTSDERAAVLEAFLQRAAR
jgi:hypothetical protein